MTAGKSRLGIRSRLFLQVAFIMSLCIAMLLFFNSRYLESVYLWNSRRGVAAMVNSIESLPNLELTYYSSLPAYELDRNVTIELYNTEDALIYRSEGAVDYSNKKINIISREEDARSKSYYTVLQEEGSAVQYTLYGRTLSNGYLIEVTSLLSPMTQSAHIATRFTAALAILGLLTSLVFISVFARRFTKPLIEMNNITGEMAALRFSRKCSTGRHDELGALADNINLLSDTLDSTLRQLNEKNESLAQDIERERRLDAARREFISSVSHELKTPISIIRGYAEGLQSLPRDASDITADYCGIIVSEADRMNELVLQLLELTMYESGGYALKPESFELYALVNDYLNACAIKLNDNGITAVNEISPGTMCFADKQKLYTVINNDVSNAISHTGGEMLIRIYSEDAEDCLRISVFNSGSSIDPQDSENLFLSFYRGDKSHSRTEGRFGLGLSIVRAIANLHGTLCGCRNAQGGAEFWFDVKKSPDNNS